MQSVGIRLREARVKSGLSLDEINARTRISPKNLAALESDDVHGISSPFLYRSFVRQFAEMVGLDYQNVSNSVELAAGQMRQPDLPGQGEHQIVRMAPIQARIKRDWSWIMPVLILLSIIALGSGGFAYLKYLNPATLHLRSVSALFPQHSADQTSLTQTIVQTAVPKVASKKDQLSDAQPSVQPAVSPIVSSTKSVIASFNESKPVSVDRIHLELAATERTWLSLSADGKTAYTGILEPAETKILESQESARLRTGNAGGVTIIFNGKPIGAIGPRGKTRTVVFSKTGFEIQPVEGVNVRSSNHIGG